MSLRWRESLCHSTTLLPSKWNSNTNAFCYFLVLQFEQFALKKRKNCQIICIVKTPLLRNSPMCDPKKPLSLKRNPPFSSANCLASSYVTSLWASRSALFPMRIITWIITEREMSYTKATFKSDMNTLKFRSKRKLNTSNYPSDNDYRIMKVFLWRETGGCLPGHCLEEKVSAFHYIFQSSWDPQKALKLAVQLLRLKVRKLILK